ncbi:MAG: hypothetical protein ACPGJV_11340 [Bacteriovoracaceae bacterium]
MKSNGFKYLVLLFLMTSFSAHGLLYIDPYVGYAVQGTSKFQNSLMNAEADYNSINYGLRVGVSSSPVAAGVQVDMGMGDYKWTDLTNGGECSDNCDEMDAQNIGVFVNFDLPILFRAYGAFFPSAKLTDGNDSKGQFQSGSELSGTGMMIGAGYTGIPFISLNLEYRTFTYDELKDNSGSSDLPVDGQSEVDLTQILFSISAPFDFL